MDVPSQELAKRVLERLVAEKLLRPDDAQKLLPKLAEGQLRPEDWRLALEKGMETSWAIAHHDK